MPGNGKDSKPPEDPWYTAGEEEEKAQEDVREANEALDRVYLDRDANRLQEMAAEADQKHAEGTLEKITQRNIKGCLPSVAVVVFILLVVSAAVVALNNRNKDDCPSQASAIAAPLAPTAQNRCPQGQPNAGGGAGGGGGSSFAGTYVLVSGLDDPTGLDVHRFGDRPPGKVGSSSARITIGANGTVTSASISTSIVQAGCKYTAEGGRPTGTVSEEGFGTVDFFPVHTEGGSSCESRKESYGLLYNFGIQGDDMYLCRANMASASTCEGGEAPSRFTKRS